MKFSDSIATITRKFSKIISKFRANKTINTILIVFSYIYPLILLVISWGDLGDLDLKNFTNPFLFSLFFGFVSLTLQAVNWDFIVNKNFTKPINNVEIYFKTLLMRRLPGGFWHWHGRVNLYSNSNNQPTKKIRKANAVEFFGLIISGATTYLLVEQFYLGLLIFIFSYLFLFFLMQEKSQNAISNYLVPLVLILFYIVCWLMGGFILYIFYNYLSPTFDFSLTKSITFWVITGTIGTIFFFMPITGIFRELTLTALLSTYLDFTKIILLSLLIRMVLYICDVILSLLVLGIISVYKKRSTRTL